MSILDQTSATLCGCFICSVIAVMPDSSIIRSSLFAVITRLSPCPCFGCTLCCLNITAITPANSTCENFLPGHIRGPSAQPTNVPAGGSRSSTFPVSPLCVSQRLGRKWSASYCDRSAALANSPRRTCLLERHGLFRRFSECKPSCQWSWARTQSIRVPARFRT